MMGSTLPVLDTQRLRLTGATRGDLLAPQQHWNEPLVRRYLFDDMPVDATAHRRGRLLAGANGIGARQWATPTGAAWRATTDQGCC
ncbi:MAG: hypothetical protein ACKOBM_02180, partial [Gammaproteobacteria bacterium]